MNGTVVMLEWTFSPHDYFEEVIEIAGQGYTMTIADDGHANAKIDSAVYQANPDIRERLQNDLNGQFFGVQLLTYRPYELSRSTMTRLHPGGRKDYFMEADTGHFGVSFANVDFQVIKDGNVAVDLKRDRIREKKRVAELVASWRTRDTLLRSLLQSHQAAINDPNNELVHLYEIREAISTKFGGKATRAKSAWYHGPSVAAPWRAL